MDPLDCPKSEAMPFEVRFDPIADHRLTLRKSKQFWKVPHHFGILPHRAEGFEIAGLPAT